MNYEAMLDRILWDPMKGPGELKKLERILAGLKRSLPGDGYSVYEDFWNIVVRHNEFMGAVLYKNAERIYGTEDPCICAGLSVLTGCLSSARYEPERCMWRALAESELRTSYYIGMSIRSLSSANLIKETVRYMQFSSDLSGTIIHFLNAAVMCRDFTLLHNVLIALAQTQWAPEVSEDDRQTLSEIVSVITEQSDIIALLNLLDLFENLKLSEVSERSVEDWKETLLVTNQPSSMILFRKIMKREGVPAENILNELYSFTSWNMKAQEYVINNFLYFSYAVCNYPEQYDHYAQMFETKNAEAAAEASDKSKEEYIKEALDLTISNIGKSSHRVFNNNIVDKPFRVLITKNPDKVSDFLDRVGAFSLYHESRSLGYKKSTTWLNSMGYYLNDYKKYTDSIMKSMSPREVMHIYMNSPLKSMVDISYLIRHLYQPKKGYRDLTDELDRYTFCGKLIRRKVSDVKIAYQVSVSNASSSYRFPIHHSWALEFMDELRNEMKADDVVYFKIMSVNEKGMVFAYDVRLRDSVERKKAPAPDQSGKGKVRSAAIKNFDKVRSGTLPLQGNNIEEQVRLFVMVFLCDENNRILVESVERDGITNEHVPYLPVSNMESSRSTMLRVLKYYTGFEDNLNAVPCGIRHLCTGYDRRSVFLIYKIMKSDLLSAKGEENARLFTRSNMKWRSIEEYMENCADDVTKSIVFALQRPWSDAVITLKAPKKEKDTEKKGECYGYQEASDPDRVYSDHADSDLSHDVALINEQGI